MSNIFIFINGIYSNDQKNGGWEKGVKKPPLYGRGHLFVYLNYGINCQRTSLLSYSIAVVACCFESIDYPWLAVSSNAGWKVPFIQALILLRQ